MVLNMLPIGNYYENDFHKSHVCPLSDFKTLTLASLDQILITATQMWNNMSYHFLQMCFYVVYSHLAASLLN